MSAIVELAFAEVAGAARSPYGVGTTEGPGARAAVTGGDIQREMPVSAKAQVRGSGFPRSSRIAASFSVSPGSTVPPGHSTVLWRCRPKRTSPRSLTTRCRRRAHSGRRAARRCGAAHDSVRANGAAACGDQLVGQRIAFAGGAEQPDVFHGEAVFGEEVFPHLSDEYPHGDRDGLGVSQQDRPLPRCG